jgi:hypothetical protein
LQLVWFPTDDWRMWKASNAPALVGRGCVYRLHAAAASHDGWHFREIPRCVSTDAAGLLYIGRTSQTRPGTGANGGWLRVEMLVRWIATGRPCRHNVAVDWARFPIAGRAYPRETLALSITPTDLPRDLERAELQEYRRSFGELPPFNGAH